MACCKPEQLKDAEAVFVNTGVQITAEGRLCLDAPLVQPSSWKVALMTWSNPGSKKLSALPSFRSVIHKLHTQRSRMVWLVAGCMLHEQSMTWSQHRPPPPPLPDNRSTLVPAMLGRLASSDLQWDLLTLPTRLGGLGLPNVKRLAQQEYGISVAVTAPLTALILEQKSSSKVLHKNNNS